jgi:hypothetical protein
MADVDVDQELERLEEMVRDGEAEITVDMAASGKHPNVDFGREPHDTRLPIDEYRMMRALSEAHGDLLPILDGVDEQVDGGMRYWHAGHAVSELRPGDDVFDWERFALFADSIIDLSADEWQTCLQFYREYDQDEAERVVDKDTEIGDVVVLLAE